MFKKFGDLHPVSIVNPADVDSKSTKKAIDKAISTIKISDTAKDIQIEKTITKDNESK